MNERIKKLRKTLDLTQQEFGERIGMKRNSIALIEGGRNTSEQTIFAICREFNVNETWLRTGEGDMFVAMPEEDLYSRAAASLLKEDNALAIEGLKLYYSLRPEEKEAVENYILQLADLIREHRAKQTESALTSSMSVEEAEAEYLKSRLKDVQKEDSSVSSTTAKTKDRRQAIG